jgi:hypothetical protein
MTMVGDGRGVGTMIVTDGPVGLGGKKVTDVVTVGRGGKMTMDVVTVGLGGAWGGSPFQSTQYC